MDKLMLKENDTFQLDGKLYRVTSASGSRVYHEFPWPGASNGNGRLTNVGAQDITKSDHGYAIELNVEGAQSRRMYWHNAIQISSASLLKGKK